MIVYLHVVKMKIQKILRTAKNHTVFDKNGSFLSSNAKPRKSFFVFFFNARLIPYNEVSTNNSFFLFLTPFTSSMSDSTNGENKENKALGTTNSSSENAFVSNENLNGQNSFKKSTSTSSNFNRSKNRVPTTRTSRLTENSKQQVVSITYEEIGLFPRSFNRVFDRFFKQLFFDVENLVIQEYRFYRYLFLTTVKCVFILLFVPLSINFIAKNYFVRPITEYYWNTNQQEIFLNSYQQKRAFTELQDFEEKIYFESLVLSNTNSFTNVTKTSESTTKTKGSNANLASAHSTSKTSDKIQTKSKNDTQQSSASSFLNLQPTYAPEFFSESVQNRLHDKIVELAVHYNEESIEAITNFFADLISFASLCYLFFALEIQINITKSFLLEVFFGLDDSKKSLFILFVTDLLVGYHSPNIWELFFSSFFDHYGLPESETTIFLLVATLPVLLDVLFKYLIFRHLNRASPATVATYHAMIE